MTNESDEAPKRDDPTAKERSDDLADPAEHPEQHAAMHTGRQSEAAPEEGTENTDFDTEEHSASDGAFGTG
jgi:hypothetical protein